MENFLQLATTQGVWAALSIALIFYITKAQEKRDDKQEEREKNYQEIIQKLSDDLLIINTIKEDVEDIKDKVNKTTDNKG